MNIKFYTHEHAHAHTRHIQESLANYSLAYYLVAWEFPSQAKHGHDFLALLAAVRIHMPEDRFILTAVLPAAKEVLQLIDLSTAAEYLDYINLVAYDFFGTWTSKTGHHAQLYTMNKDEPSASTGVAYVMSQGFPPKRILLGIPTYGRSFLKANGPGQDFNGVGGQDGTFEYGELPRKGCKEIVDRRYIAAQCVGGDGGFVTYDNPETVKVKAEFCKQKGLGVCGAQIYPISVRHKLVANYQIFNIAGALLLEWTS